MKNYDLSSLCRDAFVLLQGTTRITYRDGSYWAAADDETEHPLIPRLRAASLQSLIEEPPVAIGHEALVEQLSIERGANEGMRNFLVQLQALCEESGAPKEAAGGDLMSWLKSRLS